MTIEKEIRSIRRRRSLMWIAFGLAGPVALVVAFLRGDAREGMLTAVVLLLAGLACAATVLFSRCPRCWMLFHWRRGVRLRFFRDECVHCGLRI